MKYIVKQGDTLTKIAIQYSTSIKSIMGLNPGLRDPDHIAVGQIIVVAEHTKPRPTFGGGNRANHGREASQVLGLLGYTSASWFPYYQFIPMDMDDRCPSVKPQAVEKKHAQNAPWMKTALGEIGVAEKEGIKKANPRIMEYFKASKFWGKDDSGSKNAWCGSFVAWVMQQNNIKPVPKAYRAKEWKKFGNKIAQPVYGAIGIKSRKGGGHVAFIAGISKDGSKYYMLGGNQDNKVQISEYPKKVWEAFVFPPRYDAAKGQLPVYRGKAAKSGKES